jgi:hypothetical protein
LGHLKKQGNAEMTERSGPKQTERLMMPLLLQRLEPIAMVITPEVITVASLWGNQSASTWRVNEEANRH